MATPQSKIKSHRDLLESACRHLADLEKQENPDLDDRLAQARAVRRLAVELGISRPRIVQMRTDNQVPSNHWFGIERATDGAVKAADFDMASRGSRAVDGG